MKTATAALLSRMIVLAGLLVWHAAASSNNEHQIYAVSILEHQTVSADQLRLTVSVDTATHHLLISENPAFAGVQIVDDTGTAGSTTAVAYSGIIEDMPDSWVRVTLDGDSLNGVIDTGSERMYLSTDPTRAPRIRQILGFQNNLNRAIDHVAYAPPERESSRQISEVVLIPAGGGYQGPTDQRVTKVVRIAIVVDTLYDEALGGRGLSKAIASLNAVDGIYQQEFGLALKVDTAVIITDTETLNLRSVSLEDNLARFRDYRQIAPELDQELALVHLFTGVKTSDASVGLAYIGAACRSDGYDVSMSTPFEFPVLLTAHEIGHSLGADHDDDTDLCKLSDELLMHSQISEITRNEFSVCSIAAIEQHLTEEGCFQPAIDLSLTLTRDTEDGLIALISNTDPDQAFSAARLSMQFKNASIASAPASCMIESTTEVSCVIEGTAANDSRSLQFTVRYDTSLENTIDATLDAIDFIDVKTINNYAQIVLPASASGDETHTIAGNDDNSIPADTSAGNMPVVSGGGALDMKSLLLLFFIFLSCTHGLNSCVTRKIQR